MHGEDESADPFAWGVLLGGDAFAGGHDAFELAQIDDDIGSFEAADGTGDDVTDATLEFLHDHGFLDGAQILVHGLFKDLGGDTTELAGIQFDFHEFTDMDGGFNGAGFDDGDFIGVGTGAIGSFEFGKHLNFA